MPSISCINSAHVSIRHSGEPGPTDGRDEDPGLLLVTQIGEPLRSSFFSSAAREGHGVCGLGAGHPSHQDNFGDPTFPVPAITAPVPNAPHPAVALAVRSARSCSSASQPRAHPASGRTKTMTCSPTARSWGASTRTHRPITEIVPSRALCFDIALHPAASWRRRRQISGGLGEGEFYHAAARA
jgi:hypothetical protein